MRTQTVGDRFLRQTTMVVAAGILLSLLLSWEGRANAQGRAPGVEPKPETTRTLSPRSVRIDLNKASEGDLMELPGIWRSVRYAIMRARPYHRTEELVERRIISRRAYKRIKPLITVGEP